MNADFRISSCYRKRLSKGTRIYQIVYGGIVAGVCIARFELYFIPLITVGLFSIGYGVTGFQWFKTRNSIAIADGMLVMKSSFEWTIRKRLGDIRHVVFDSPDELLIEFDGYAKTYNLSWLSPDEFQQVQNKFRELSLMD
jgi:hypothetical protein